MQIGLIHNSTLFRDAHATILAWMQGLDKAKPQNEPPPYSIAHTLCGTHRRDRARSIDSNKRDRYDPHQHDPRNPMMVPLTKLRSHQESAIMHLNAYTKGVRGEYPRSKQKTKAYNYATTRSATNCQASLT